MIKVYHNKQFINFSFASELKAMKLLNQMSASDVKMVAEVNTDDLDEAYRLTNHIDSDWTKNPELPWTNPKSRSTSVGDIMYSVSEDRWYLVASFGFFSIDMPDHLIESLSIPGSLD